MPRRYTLGKRADQKEETRARILAAAVELVRSGGSAAATTLAVARAADVAPGTVTNHFSGQGDLIAAVADAALAELRMPDPDLFAGIDDPAERIGLLAREMAAFFERSEGWWRVFAADPTLSAASSGAEARFLAEFDRLVRLALGPLAADDTTRAVVGTIIGSPTFIGLRSAGLAADEAADVAIDLVLPWLERRVG